MTEQQQQHLRFDYKLYLSLVRATQGCSCDLSNKADVQPNRSIGNDAARQSPVGEPAANTTCSVPVKIRSSDCKLPGKEQEPAVTQAASKSRPNKQKARGNSRRLRTTQKSHEQPDYVGFKFRTDEEILDFVLTDDRRRSARSQDVQSSRPTKMDKKKRHVRITKSAPSKQVRSVLSSSTSSHPTADDMSKKPAMTTTGSNSKQVPSDLLTSTAAAHHQVETSEQPTPPCGSFAGMKKIEEKNVQRIVCGEDSFNFNEVVTYLLQSWDEVQQLLDAGSPDVVVYSPPDVIPVERDRQGSMI